MPVKSSVSRSGSISPPEFPFSWPTIQSLSGGELFAPFKSSERSVSMGGAD